MKSYISYIQDLSKTDNDYTDPSKLLNNKLLSLLKAFEDEAYYILYRYYMYNDVNVSEQLQILKKLYLFNFVIQHVYNWFDGDRTIFEIINTCKNNNKLPVEKISFTQQKKMCNYAFYDGVSCNDIYLQINDLKKLSQDKGYDKKAFGGKL